MPANFKVSPAFNPKMTILVKVIRLFTKSSKTGPALKVLSILVSFTNNTALKLNEPAPSFIPNN